MVPYTSFELKSKYSHLLSTFCTSQHMLTQTIAQLKRQLGDTERQNEDVAQRYVTLQSEVRYVCNTRRVCARPDVWAW